MFGDLEFKLFGLKAADLECLLDRGGEVFLLKLAGRDVDGDGELDAEATLEGGDLFAGLE